MTNPTAPAWTQVLDDLLRGGAEPDGGAQLVVSDGSGAAVFIAPLARHWRLDDEDQQCLWIRPVPTDLHFDLGACRRRALQFSSVATDGDELVFELWNGDLARVQRAQEPQRRLLGEWDAFVLTRLPVSVEAALDVLEEDS